jgi:DNA recombination protein RmuC
MDAILPIIMFVVGFAAGGGILWFLNRQRVEDARQRERSTALANICVADERAAAKDSEIKKLERKIAEKDLLITSLSEEKNQLERDQAVLAISTRKDKESLQEKIEFLNNTKETLKNDFSVIAVEALKQNNEDFGKRAQPLTQSLNEIRSRIDIVDNCAKDLTQETSKLVKALQKPEVRGQWGEMHLRRVMEVTGMIEYCDFHEQMVIGEESNQRPDLVIHLPGNRNLAVDAKAPIQAFLDAAQAVDEETRQAKLIDFIRHVRDRIKQLGGKAYHQSLDCSPEFVVLYLPTEAIFSTALMLDAGLFEFAAEQYRVHLAGPTTFLSLVRVVAYDWRQDAVAKNAGEICELAEDLYKRLADFGGHMSKLGDNLKRSAEAYNKAVGSLESRVMPQARRFEQLGAAPADRRIETQAPIETSVRNLQCPEFKIAEIDGEPIEPELLTRPR